MCRRVDATASWSGFNYQGKIGLYIVLKTINEVVFGPDDNYELEFEWLEDFAIRNGEDNYISVHQVKAKDNRYLTGYATAINFLQTIVDSHIVSEDKAYLHVIKNLDDTHNFLYRYTIDEEEQTFCPLNRIDKLIQDEIETYFYNENITGQNKETHFYRLLAVLDDHISNRHQEIHLDPLPKDDPRRNPTTIQFSEIIGYLNEDLSGYTQEKLLLEKQAYFSEIIDDYCINRTEEEQEKIRKFQRKILSLSQADFFRFIKNISPHENCSDSENLNLTDFQTLLQKNSTKNPLIKSIQNIDKDYIVNDNVLLEYVVNGECYVPTTIDDDDDDISTTCQKIINNSKIIDILYDKHYLINRDIDGMYIKDLLYRISDVDRNTYGDPKFVDIQEIKLIKISTAKDKIDE